MGIRVRKLEFARSRRSRKRVEKILSRKNSGKSDDSGSWRTKSGRHKRSGYCPVGKFFGEIKRVVDLDEGRDVFLDTCQIRPGSPQDEFSLLKRYVNGLKKVPAFLGDDKYKVVREDIDVWASEIEDLMGRQNVVVTQGVMGEFGHLLSKIIKRVKGQSVSSDLKDKAVEPAVRMYAAHWQNYVRNREYEQDPLVDMIFRLIPRGVTEGSSDPPSKTDRYLLAFALERGLVEGRKTLTMTRDGAIFPTLQRLHTVYHEVPEALETEDLFGTIDNLFKADISVGATYQGKTPKYQQIGRFRNFFNN